MIPGIVASQAMIAQGGGGPVLEPSWTSAISTGNRQMLMDVSVHGGLTTGNGNVRYWIDGTSGSNGGTFSFDWNSATGDGSDYILFDLYDVPANICGFKIFQSSTTSHGAWNFEGSNDKSNWAVIHSFTMTGSPTGVETTFDNGVNYRYYRFRHMSGNRSSIPYQYEIEFYAGYSGEIETSWEDEISEGDRTSIITGTVTNISLTGAIARWFDNLFGNNTSESNWWNTANGNGTGFITLDFGTPRRIEGYRLRGGEYAHGMWEIAGSDDNSNWDVIFEGRLNSGADTPICFRNKEYYRYYRFRHLSGQRLNSPWLNEMYFLAKS